MRLIQINSEKNYQEEERPETNFTNRKKGPEIAVNKLY